MTKKINIDLSPAGTFMTCIIIGILGYFVYDCDITSAIAVIGISMVVGVVTLLSFIPVLGWIAAILISYYWIIPAMLEITGLEHTWLITAIFWMNVGIGLVITILMMVAIGAVFSRRKY